MVALFDLITASSDIIEEPTEEESVFAQLFGEEDEHPVTAALARRQKALSAPTVPVVQRYCAFLGRTFKASRTRTCMCSDRDCDICSALYFN